MTTVKPGPDPWLSREQVLDAAVALVDAEGARALSARRLASELGVSSATPYRYFSNRDRMIDALIERVLPDPNDAVGDLPWQQQLIEAMTAVHAALYRHPGILDVMMVRGAGGPVLDPWRDATLRILRSAGLNGRASARAGGMLISLVFGSVISERFRARDPENERRRILELPDQEFPDLVASAESYPYYRGDPLAFDFALRHLVKAIDAARDELAADSVDARKSGAGGYVPGTVTD